MAIAGNRHCANCISELSFPMATCFGLLLIFKHYFNNNFNAPFSALTLLGIRPVKTEWWGAGVVICLERGADLHMAQLMPLSLTVSWFSKIQIGFTFLVLAHPGSPGQRAVKWVCKCVCVLCSL